MIDNPPLDPIAAAGAHSCPFCGKSKPLMLGSLDRHVSKMWRVICSQCDCEGPAGDTERQAIDLWNTRTTVQRNAQVMGLFGYEKVLYEGKLFHGIER